MPTYSRFNRRTQALVAQMGENWYSAAECRSDETHIEIDVRHYVRRGSCPASCWIGLFAGLGQTVTLYE